MKKFALNGIDDFFALLVRRKWWLIVPATLIAITTLLAALLVPDVYRSESVIVMDPREIPNDVVKDLVSLSAAERLMAVQQHILSRSNLLRVVSEFEDELRRYHLMSPPEQVERLRKAIRLESEINERAQQTPISYFKIAYDERSPELAQRVVGRLASLFIEFDNRTREQQIFGTTEFLDSEVAKVAEQLAQADDQLRILKEAHNNELPTQLEANLRAMDRLQQQRQENREALDRYVTLRLSLERQLSETPRHLPAAAQDTLIPPEQANYHQKLQQLQQLRARYTRSHPDVLRLQAELESLREALPATTPLPAAPGEAAPNPVFRQLTNQLEEVQTEIAIRQRERHWIEQEIARHSSRVQNTPRREQEIASLTRHRDELARQLDDLKGKLAQARMAETLETRQKGAQFVILDPATLPLEPSGPNRLALILSGLILGLAAGAALAFGVDYFDQKIWTYTDVERQLGIPVLAEIPQILSAEDLRRRRLDAVRRAALVSGTAGLLIAAFLLIQKNRHLQALTIDYLSQMLGV